ncbi:TAXI family TRAP transporter solute-binding subunit [Deinococcus multiflagellatus]|uniref:TAXI family TRAP transporter solute-binding subunit n=1 Tax=Deinococcus multiflagellatus TaxID=1656887 RepID=UPI001CCB4397|nr:TAXI family TRAP transporter solute-binding subunit [Deinococcus multiflagellatus]MBZ9713383.1 TRAP transporter substrate-binding protein [Deinococcus multiflagellatus]
MKRRMLSLATLLLCAPLSGAATPTFLNVATGSSTGTYSTMFKNIGKVCAQSAYLKERGTSGSLENIDLLLGNEVSLAFVQSDVLKAKEQIDGDARVQNIKALLPLHSEEVHLFAKPVVQKRDLLGRVTTTGVGTFNDLKGKRVAAWGGSIITARVLSAKLGVPFAVLSVKDRDSAFALLRANQADAVLAVVGQPATWVKDLSGVNLIPVPYAPALQGIYTSAKLLYPTLGAGSVPTVAVQSVLATRDFKTPEKKDLLLKYQKCAMSKLVNLQEDEGMHPKWQEVTFKTWPWPQYK